MRRFCIYSAVISISFLDNNFGLPLLSIASQRFEMKMISGTVRNLAIHQDITKGFGILKMGSRDTIGRFGGGAWGKVNGADFNGDGTIDLAVTFGAGGGAAGTYSGLFIYRNIGTKKKGLLDSGFQLASHEKTQAKAPVIGDINRDGKPDVFCNGYLYINQSAKHEIKFSKGIPSSAPHWPHPGDTDWKHRNITDHFIDDDWKLILKDGLTGNIETLHPGGKELLEDIFIRPFVCDWNGDGLQDILAGQESGHISFIENRGGRLQTEKLISQKNPNVKSGCISVPMVCDWNGDGIPDLIIGNAAGYIEYFEGTSEGFKPPKRLDALGETIRIQAGEYGSIQGPQEARWGYAAPFAADWDGDGDLDLLAGCVTGEIYFYENIGSRTSPRLAAPKKLTVDWGDRHPPYPEGIRFKPEKDVLVTQWRCRPCVMDWNGDGLQDLITVDDKGLLALYPRYRRNDGSLGLHPAEYPFLDEGGNPLRFCNEKAPGRNGRIVFDLVDWNGDGKLDIIRSGSSPDGKNLDSHSNFTYYECIRYEAEHRAVFKNIGELIPAAQIRLQGHNSSPWAVDIDGDGQLDLISGCEDGNIYWFSRKWIDQLQHNRD